MAPGSSRPCPQTARAALSDLLRALVACVSRLFGCPRPSRDVPRTGGQQFHGEPTSAVDSSVLLAPERPADDSAIDLAQIDVACAGPIVIAHEVVGTPPSAFVGASAISADAVASSPLLAPERPADDGAIDLAQIGLVDERPSAAPHDLRTPPAAFASAPASARTAAPPLAEPPVVAPARQPAAAPGEQLVWRDEFEYEGLPDPARWEFQTNCNKWIHQPSHGELQWYTEGRVENACARDGALRITALREPCNGCDFSSARLRTRTRGDWVCGRVDVCAKLPPARRGLWGAIWLAPTDNAYGRWPASGEIDIMEQIGADPGVVRASVHTDAHNHRNGTHRLEETTLEDAHETFHTYTVQWTPDRLRFSIDGAEPYFEFAREVEQASAPPAEEDAQPAPGERAGKVDTDDGAWRTWPFDQRFHLILNLAVGGKWAGQDGIADDVCPASFEVAHVRVFQ